LDSCENAAKRKIANALWFSLMLAGIIVVKRMDVLRLFTNVD